jgi:predicted nucleic acid-binding Zn ribbon protein
MNGYVNWDGITAEQLTDDPEVTCPKCKKGFKAEIQIVTSA